MGFQQQILFAEFLLHSWVFEISVPIHYKYLVIDFTNNLDLIRGVLKFP